LFVYTKQEKKKKTNVFLKTDFSFLLKKGEDFLKKKNVSFSFFHNKNHYNTTQQKIPLLIFFLLRRTKKKKNENVNSLKTRNLVISSLNSSTHKKKAKEGSLNLQKHIFYKKKSASKKIQNQGKKN
jgi:hypothetical protein